MDDWYSELKKLDGHKCFTLTQNFPAVMHIDDSGVTIEYKTGRSMKLPRALLEKAFQKLQAKGMLTLEDVHNKLTNGNGAKTDRLMAVLREVPGIGYSGEPRTLFVK